MSVAKLGKSNKWTVNTPTAVAGVRGTVFGINVNSKKKNEVAVFEGEVEVKNKKNVGKPT